MSFVLFINFAVIGVYRFHSGDLHSDVLSHLFDLIVYYIGLNVNENTDLTFCMDVRRYESVLLLNLFETTNVHVLTDYCDLCCKSLFYSLGGIQCPRLSHECIDISCGGVQCLCSNICYISTEFLILCYEVSLSIYFYCNCFLSVLRQSGSYDTLCCNTACFFLCGCQTFFTQEIYCCFHITFGSCQCFLAVHHTCTSHLS